MVARGCWNFTCCSVESVEVVSTQEYQYTKTTNWMEIAKQGERWNSDQLFVGITFFWQDVNIPSYIRISSKVFTGTLFKPSNRTERHKLLNTAQFNNRVHTIRHELDRNIPIELSLGYSHLSFPRHLYGFGTFSITNRFPHRSHKMKRVPKKVHAICGLLRGGRTNRPKHELSRITSFLGDQHQTTVSKGSSCNQVVQVVHVNILYTLYILINVVHISIYKRIILVCCVWWGSVGVFDHCLSF